MEEKGEITDDFIQKRIASGKVISVLLVAVRRKTGI
jgi:hypothetical protein